MQRISVFLLLLFAAPALRAESWSDWATASDAPLRARFEPFADTREPSFSRGDPSGYADLYAETAHPGDLVLERTPWGGTLPPGPLEVRVESVRVPRNQTNLPQLSSNEHHAENPHLPFPPPAGTAQEAVFVSVRRTDAAPAFPLRVPVRLTDERTGWRLSDDVGAFTRVRWEVRDASGATVARGVLPEAFGRDVRFVAALDATTETEPPALAGVTAARPTPATETAWAFLSDGIRDTFLDVGSPLAEDDPEGFARFVRRSRLLGIQTRATDLPVVRYLSEAGAGPGRDILRFGTDHSRSHVQTLAESFPGSRYGDSTDPAAREAAEKLAPARIPGPGLGRSVGPFLTVTTLFLLVYAVGAGVILIRHFAFRRGERRLAVWRALPLWSVVCSAFALFVLPLAPDRAPRADITEWRFGVAGLPEALTVADGRAHTFSSEPTVWSIPSDGWFAPFSWSSGERNSRARPWAVQTLDDASGALTMRGPEGERGESESVRAMRFAPHESPVDLSPDPDARAEDFRQMLPRPKDDVDAPSAETEAAWTALLLDWTARGSRALLRTPSRTVTAREDLDGVWVFARGQWYTVGPMKAGASAALAPEMRLRAAPAADVLKDGSQSLFDVAPFLVDLSGVVPVAEAELARLTGTERTQSSSGDGGESYESSPAPKPASLVPDEAFLERLGSAFVVAVRPGAGGRTCLRPVAEEGGEPFSEEGRIVWMELFP